MAYFDNPAYNRKLETAATLTGPERYRAYGALDVDLARNAAPLVAIANTATATSSRPESAATPTSPCTDSTSRRSA